MTRPRRRKPSTGNLFDAERVLLESSEMAWRRMAEMNRRMLVIQGEAAKATMETLRTGAKAADATGQYLKATRAYLDFLSAFWKYRPGGYQPPR
jgi:hypothetical protein